MASPGTGRHGRYGCLRACCPQESAVPGGRPDVAPQFLGYLRRHSRRVSEVLARLEDDEVLPIRHERFVARPKDGLRDVLAFVGLDASDAYLDACAALVDESPHRTRFKVRWTPAQIAEVADVVRTCPWFDGYTFDA